MPPLFLALILAADFGGPLNFLGNGGFEELVVDRPARWESFVEPQDGAFARIDDGAAHGRYCAQLHIPRPYDVDPINNWSQNVVGALSGKTFRLTGQIKVEAATEAAIWVQCWRRRPWGVAKFVTTSTDQPVYGTQDWQAVDAEFTVPDSTEALTVRCVLKGTGTAWFDEVALVEVEKPEVETDDEEPGGDGRSEASSDAPAPRIAPLPDDAALLAERADVRALVQRLRNLRESNELLTDSLQFLQETNVDLLEQILKIREQMESLRVDRRAEEGDAPDLALPDLPRMPESPTPPLVPHGEDWRTLQTWKNYRSNNSE